MNEIVFETESGARYWMRGGKIRRLNPDHEKRADGQWLKLVNEPVIEVGRRATLLVEPLSSYGPDDYGNSGEAAFTQRITTPVVGVEVR